MSKINDGGCAFPCETSMYASSGRGMSLWDYFAGKAMQGICAHADTWGLSTNENIATASYDLADAMLAERAK